MIGVEIIFIFLGILILKLYDSVMDYPSKIIIDIHRIGNTTFNSMEVILDDEIKLSEFASWLDNRFEIGNYPVLFTLKEDFINRDTGIKLEENEIKFEFAKSEIDDNVVYYLESTYPYWLTSSIGVYENGRFRSIQNILRSRIQRELDEFLIFHFPTSWQVEVTEDYAQYDGGLINGDLVGDIGKGISFRDNLGRVNYVRYCRFSHIRVRSCVVSTNYEHYPIYPTKIKTYQSNFLWSLYYKILGVRIFKKLGLFILFFPGFYQSRAETRNYHKYHTIAYKNKYAKILSYIKVIIYVLKEIIFGGWGFGGSSSLEYKYYRRCRILEKFVWMFLAGLVSGVISKILFVNSYSQGAIK